MTAIPLEIGLLLLLSAASAKDQRQIVSSGHYCDVICDEEIHTMEPVCATDGNLYKSRCELNKAQCIAAHGGDKLFTVSIGACVQLDTPCTEVFKAKCVPHEVAAFTGMTDGFEPLCGSNNRTYGSACEFRTAQCYYEQTSAPPLTVAHTGKCALDPSNSYMVNCSNYIPTIPSGVAIEGGAQAVPHPIACPKIYDPLCTLDGRTFPSDCVFCNFVLLSRLLGEDNIAYALHKGQCAKNEIFG